MSKRIFQGLAALLLTLTVVGGAAAQPAPAGGPVTTLAQVKAKQWEELTWLRDMHKRQWEELRGQNELEWAAWQAEKPLVSDDWQVSKPPRMDREHGIIAAWGKQRVGLSKRCYDEWSLLLLSHEEERRVFFQRQREGRLKGRTR